MADILYIDNGYVDDYYAQTGITVIYSTYPYVIFIPKIAMTLTQVSPIEVYDLDLNATRLRLKDLEDDDIGMVYPQTHTHNTEVTVGGVTLARVLEITDDYVVEFEDGKHAVNLKGANTNLGDKVLVNNVSVRVSNSAGLVTSQAIEFGEYGAAVTVDQATGETGTIYPLGTLRKPVNSFQDARLIADVRGFAEIDVIGNATLDTGDVLSGFKLKGQSDLRTTLTINSGSETSNCEIRNATVNGNLDGNTKIVGCSISSLNYIQGEVIDSTLTGGRISVGGAGIAQFHKCRSGDPTNIPVIDCNGADDSSTTNIIVTEYSGWLRLEDLASGAFAQLNFTAAELYVDLTTCTNGTIVINGNCNVYDQDGNDLDSGTYNGSFIVMNKAIHGEHLHEIWQKQGLDPGNPVTITDNQIAFDDKTIDIAQPDTNTTTVTRQ